MSIKHRNIIYCGGVLCVPAARAEFLVQRGLAQYSEIAESLAMAETADTAVEAERPERPLEAETAEAPPAADAGGQEPRKRRPPGRRGSGRRRTSR